MFLSLLLEEYTRRFHSSTHSTLLANSLRRVVKPFKSGNPGRSGQIAIKPSNEANEIDGSSNAKMLQVRFRQPQIPRTAQVKGAHPLRNSRFNPGPQGIGLLEGFGALPLPCWL